jgi:hypothetical protein
VLTALTGRSVVSQRVRADLPGEPRSVRQPMQNVYRVVARETPPHTVNEQVVFQHSLSTDA